MDPNPVAQTATAAPGAEMPPPSIQWAQRPDGTWGWVDSAQGRTWDAYGNPVEAPATPGAAPTPAGYVAPGAPPAGTQPTPYQQQQTQAASMIDWFKKPENAPNKWNVYEFGKLKTSGKEAAIAGAEAAGYDAIDTVETLQNIMPRATGPAKGYVAPLSRR